MDRLELGSALASFLLSLPDVSMVMRSGGTVIVVFADGSVYEVGVADVK